MADDAAPLARKLANALIPDALPASAVAKFGTPVVGVLDHFRNSQGGLWVGFTVEKDAYWLMADPTRVRPLAGSTWLLWVTIALMATVLGSAAIAPGLNLAIIGAPGCYLNSTADVIQPIFPLLGATHPWTLPIPNTAALSGTHVYCQGALLVPPGTNAFGVLTANSVNLTIGTL